MSRRPIYMRSSHRGVKILLAVLAILAGSWYLYKNIFVFDVQKVIDGSVLKEKNFNAEVKEIVSPKYGIKAYLLEDHTNPIISVSFGFKNAGYAADNEDEQGTAVMAAALLTEGAGERDSQAFKEILENNAIGMSFSAGKDDFNGSLLTTKVNRRTAYDLLKDVLSKPRFDTVDLERNKLQMLEALKRQKELPESVLGLEFMKDLYGSHPYGRNPLGVEEHIRRLNADKLKNFVQNNLSRNNLIVGVAGDITAIEAKNMLDDIFGILPENGKVNFIREAKIDFDGRKKEFKLAAGQNVVMKAAPGVNRSDKDFYPLFVANYVLGGSGLNSKLSQEIREKRGLTYGVYSYLSLDDKSPLLVASFSATADKFGKADRLFDEVWFGFGKNGISKAELENAKEYLTASYNLRFASIQSISDILTAMQKYNLGLDFLKKRNSYVEQVKLEDVNRAAGKYFNDKLVSFAVGSF